MPTIPPDIQEKLTILESLLPTDPQRHHIEPLIVDKIKNKEIDAASTQFSLSFSSLEQLIPHLSESTLLSYFMASSRLYTNHMTCSPDMAAPIKTVLSHLIKPYSYAIGLLIQTVLMFIPKDPEFDEIRSMLQETLIQQFIQAYDALPEWKKHYVWSIVSSVSVYYLRPHNRPVLRIATHPKCQHIFVDPKIQPPDKPWAVLNFGSSRWTELYMSIWTGQQLTAMLKKIKNQYTRIRLIKLVGDIWSTEEITQYLTKSVRRNPSALSVILELPNVSPFILMTYAARNHPTAIEMLKQRYGQEK